MKNFNTPIGVIMMIMLFNACSKDSINTPTKINATTKQSNSSGTLTVAPAKGIVYSSVTITGSNFSTTPSNNVVKFNGLAAVVNSATSTQIVATVPAGATTGTITVTVNGTKSTSANSFQVLQMVQAGSKQTNNIAIYSITSDNNGSLYGVGSKLIVPSGGGLANQYFIFKYNGTLSYFYTAPTNAGALIYSLSNLAFDAQNNVYTALASLNDNGKGSGNYTTEILKISSSGQASVLVGGPPNAGIVDNQFHATPLYSMISDGQGNLYATDDDGIIKVTPVGSISYLPGTAQFTSRASGNAIIARDLIGNAYFSDAYTNGSHAYFRVQKVSATGTVSTILDSLTTSISSIVPDASNNIFVSTVTTPTTLTNKIYIINQAGAVNVLPITFNGTLECIGIDNSGKFYTATGSSTTAGAITQYSFQ